MKPEYLNLYTKDGKLTNEKGVRGTPSDYYKGISIIFIENDKGEFLLQKTSKKRSNVYATTGGHVDYGETFLSTIVREVKEELGLEVEANNVKEVCSYLYTNKYSDVYTEKYLIKVFYLKKNIDIKKLKIQKDEVSFVDWYKVDEIDKLIEENQFRDGNIEGYQYIKELNKTN